MMIAGIGFAMMAWRTAINRAGLSRSLVHELPAGRDQVKRAPRIYRASAEYYRIIDLAESLWLYRDHNWTTQVKL
jgi:hypothetical protein